MAPPGYTRFWDKLNGEGTTSEGRATLSTIEESVNISGIPRPGKLLYVINLIVTLVCTVDLRYCDYRLVIKIGNCDYVFPIPDSKCHFSTGHLSPSDNSLFVLVPR